jgi:hypothetical protein
MAKRTMKKRSMKKGTRKMNPYMTFANKHRKEVMRKHPGWSIIQVAKELGSMYRAQKK